MDITRIKELSKAYYDKGLHFSALAVMEQTKGAEASEHDKFMYADLLRLCGHYNKALETFRAIDIEKVPPASQYLVQLNIGSLYMDMGMKEAAKGELEKCFSYPDCDTVPYVYYATLLMQDGNNAEAIKFLESALEKDGDIDEVYYNLATNHAILGNYTTARKCIDECLKLDPDFPNGKTLSDDLDALLLIEADSL